MVHCSTLSINEYNALQYTIEQWIQCIAACNKTMIQYFVVCYQTMNTMHCGMLSNHEYNAIVACYQTMNTVHCSMLSNHNNSALQYAIKQRIQGSVLSNHDTMYCSTLSNNENSALRHTIKYQNNAL